MMTSANKVGGWVKKGQNHDDVILEWSLTVIGFESLSQILTTLPRLLSLVWPAFGIELHQNSFSIFQFGITAIPVNMSAC